jgi:hypothetical protein
MSVASSLDLKPSVRSRAEAAGSLGSPGDAVLIERGMPRWLLLSCPCGCGEILSINLDSRAGPAWRLYRSEKAGASVFPSVWRDSGCGSHFIIWRDRILLFDREDEDFQSPARTGDIAALSVIVRERMPAAGFISYVDIAERCGAVPWDILDACRYLVRAGIVREGAGKQRATFRRV